MWSSEFRLSMEYAHDREAGSYHSHGEPAECDLCGRTALCNKNDGMVACQSCQRELLPSGWAL